jgi:hypothetical protein
VPRARADRRELTDFHQRISEDITRQSGAVFVGQFTFQQEASRARGDEVTAALGVREQVELVAHAFALAVLTEWLDFKFPEHRAPVSLP